MSPLPWGAFFTILAQWIIVFSIMYGAAFAGLDLARRWTTYRRVDAALFRRDPVAWDSLRAELDTTGGVLKPEPRLALLNNPVLFPGVEKMAGRCGTCRDQYFEHDLEGRCMTDKCRALGDDQVCRGAITAVVLGTGKHPDWSSPSRWPLFCRLCKHRMADHVLDISGAYMCPLGPEGPGHDSPSTPATGIDYSRGIQ